VLGHLSLDVADLAGSADYYRDVLGLLGFEPWERPGAFLCFRPSAGHRGPVVFVYAARVPGGRPAAVGAPGVGHLAFTVPDRASVRRVHAVVVAHGCVVVHEPQEFPEYPPPYYATFWVDPSGVRLEAVCHHDREG